MIDTAEIETSESGVVMPAGVADAVSVREIVVGFVGRLDPESVPLPDVVAVWEAVNRIEHLAASAKTLLARRVDESRAWQRGGYKTADEFLAVKAGVTAGEARRALDTSKKLRDLPRTRDAARRGELSGPQLGLVADAAAANPAAEGSLLDQAGRGTLRDLRDAATRARAAADRDRAATEARIHRRRSVRTWTDPDGTWRLDARGTVADGARIEQALTIAGDRRFRAAAKRGERHGRDAYTFDALVDLAAHATGTNAAEPGSCADDAPRTAPPARVTPQYQLHVRVDVEALRRGSVQGDELCEIRGVGPISVERARALLGEAMVDIVITKGVEVATIAPAGRRWTAHQRLAALWDSPRCCIDGCPRGAIEIDHRQPFTQGGPTILANHDPYCGHHHDLKTYQGWAVTGPRHRRRMVPPDDPVHPEHRPRGPDGC
jgi:hypothetical protein